MTYVLFPDEGHGFARPENRLAFYAVTEAFLAQAPRRPLRADRRRVQGIVGHGPARGGADPQSERVAACRSGDQLALTATGMQTRALSCCLFVALTVAGSGADESSASVRGRAPLTGDGRSPDRRLRVPRRGRAHHGGRRPRHVQGARGCHGRRSAWQDGHPGAHRRAQPPWLHRRAHRHHGSGELHTRQPARSSAALCLLRHRRDAESWSRSRRAALRAARHAHTRCGALSDRRARHRDAERRTERGLLEGRGLRRDDGGRGAGARCASWPRRKWTSSRSGWTTGTRPSPRCRRRSIGRSSTRHTCAVFAWSRTSTTSRTRRSCCEPASTASRTASATSRWTKRS